MCRTHAIAGCLGRPNGPEKDRHQVHRRTFFFALGCSLALLCFVVSLMPITWLSCGLEMDFGGCSTNTHSAPPLPAPLHTQPDRMQSDARCVHPFPSLLGARVPLVNTLNLVSALIHTLHSPPRPHPPVQITLSKRKTGLLKKAYVAQLSPTHAHSNTHTLRFSSSPSVCSSLCEPHSSLCTCGQSVTTHEMVLNAPL